MRSVINVRQTIAAGVVIGVLSGIPATSFAASRGVSAVEPTHSTTGVVQSVNSTSLVIAHSGKQRGEMTFVLSPSTHRAGMVDIGSTVSVRYVDDGTMHVATAVTAEHPKQEGVHAMIKGN